MGSTYLFYDIETTGLNPCFDQILQFAAIRTDLNLREIERHEFRIRLNPDVIPSPQAMLIHGLTIADIQQGMPEVEAVRKIHQLVNTPGTISLGYNTLSFDDEFLRFSFYRNLLPPYTHQYANQCYRMDIFPITVLYYLYQPNAMQWPMIDGKLRLKLEYLNQVNQWVQGDAHDAMVDVEATLALTRQLFKHTELWNYVRGYFDKEVDKERIRKLEGGFEIKGETFREGLVLSSKLGYENNFQAPVICMGQHRHYKNQTVWLRLDHQPLQKTVAQQINETNFTFNKKWGEELFIFPAHQRYLEKIHLERQTLANQNKRWLYERPELWYEMCDYYQNYIYPKVPDLDIDAALYEIGFPSYQEEILFQKFHQAQPESQLRIAQQFPNEKRRLQAYRILGRNHSNYLDSRGHEYFQNYLYGIYEDENPRMKDYRNQHKLTAKDALIEVNALRDKKDYDEINLELLESLQMYLLGKCKESR